MKQLSYFIYILIPFLFSCSNGQSTSNDCKELYDHYQNNVMDARYDSADFYLTQAIECDPSNLQYVTELYGMRRQNGQTEKALDAIRKVQKLNDGVEFKVTEELLKYEINGTLDTGKIHDYYESFQSKISKGGLSETDLFYYVALSDFVEGKEEAMKELTRYRGQVESHTGLLTMIEKLISDKDSLYVIREAFNVR